MDKNRVKEYCFVAAFTVLLFLGVSNFSKIQGALRVVTGLLTPFIIGLVVAFLLSGPLRFFENRVFLPLEKDKRKWVRGLRRPLAMVCSYIIVFTAILILLWVVIPQLSKSITKLTASIPTKEVLQSELEKFAVSLNLTSEVWNDIWKQLSNVLEGLFTNLLGLIPQMFNVFLPRIYNVAVSVGSGMFNFLIGIVVSAYLLTSKEQLFSQLSRLNRAFMPKWLSGRLAETAHITVKTFGNYVTGQLLDAVIVGVACVTILSIFRFPYALLIGVVMGCTNVIPFFGPFIGFVPGFLILVIEDPKLALWYALIVVIVQQIDGNFIVPKVVGDSVGLPPLWVLFSVTVGGGLFGIAGMVIGMPVFAVFYQLLGKATHRRVGNAQPVPTASDPPTSAPPS